jgi:protein pelota
MEIISSDFKKGTVKLKINDPEDLWYLSHLIDPEDQLKGKTTRKIKIGDGDNAKVVRKTLTLKIKSESIDFTDADCLKVNGKITESPEDIPHGSYHSISLHVGDQLILEKVKWLKYQKQKLKEASEKKYTFIICIIDREEAIFALTKKSGNEIILRLKGDVPKKAKEVTIKKDFHQEIIASLQSYFERYNPEKVILASPAFYKDDLYKKISSADLKKRMVLAACSDVSKSSLDEVMRSPELHKILENSRVRTEQIVVEELLSEIKKNNLAGYGFDDVKKAVFAGAVSKLLITDDFIQQKRADEEYDELDQLMKQVDSAQGEIFIISSKHESGKKLDGLGGVGVILRYKLEW